MKRGSESAHIKMIHHSEAYSRLLSLALANSGSCVQSSSNSLPVFYQRETASFHVDRKVRIRNCNRYPFRKCAERYNGQLRWLGCR